MDGFRDRQMKKFIDEIISEKGVGLGENNLEMERDRLFRILNDGINDAVINALPDGEVEALDGLVREKGDDLTEDEALDIIVDSRDTIDIAVRRAMESFREEYLKGEI